MGLDFTSHDDVVFDRAPLRTVLTQIRFPPVLSLLTEVGVTGFQAALRDEYPVFLPPERQAAVSVSPGGVGVEASAPVWRLSDQASRWTVGLAVDFVSLETGYYDGIDHFLERFGRVLKALRQTVRPADSLRIGLRKVNALPMPDARDTMSLAAMVRPEMLGPLAVKHFPAPICLSYSQLQFADDDNMLAVRYGLQGELSEKDEPKGDFVMDLDYYTERPYAIGSGSEISGLLRYFSEGITSFFHWAVLDTYKESLGPRPRRETGASS